MAQRIEWEKYWNDLGTSDFLNAFLQKKILEQTNIDIQMKTKMLTNFFVESVNVLKYRY